MKFSSDRQPCRKVGTRLRLVSDDARVARAPSPAMNRSFCVRPILAFPERSRGDVQCDLTSACETLMLKLSCQASVPRDAFPPTPPGPEGSNGNGLLRVQWVADAWLNPALLRKIALHL